MAIDDKILNKIKKCLALGASPNPHEAAVAMRQAHSLMQKHGVDAQQITMADIGEVAIDSRTMARDKPAQWEAALAAMVGRAFGCRLLIQRMLYPEDMRRVCNEGKFLFIGAKAQAEIAAYTASVLARKCKTSRQKWIAENLSDFSTKRGTRSKVTRMGDAYAEGWVFSIQKLVTDFANPPEIEQAIEHFIQKTSSGQEAPTRKLDKRRIGQHEMLAASMGALAAQNESIHRPMGHQKRQILALSSSNKTAPAPRAQQPLF